jgi:hypothetical protein
LDAGVLSGLDTRWSVISQSVDDRTSVELGSGDATVGLPDDSLAGSGVRKLNKSR